MIAMVAVVMMMGQASATVTVTPASGGGAISADDVGTGGWTSLGIITISESAAAEIGTGTIILTLPVGFEYDDSITPSVVVTGTGPQLAATFTSINATQLTVTVNTASNSETDNRLLIGSTTAINVRPTAGNPLASGNIFVAEASTSAITGVTEGGAGTNFGMLQEIHGAAAKLAFTTLPAGSVSGVALTTQPVVEVQDTYGNTDTTSTADVVAAEDDAGALTGTITQAAVAGVATFTDLVYTATADQETFQIDVTSGTLTGAASGDVTSDVVATKFVILDPTDGTVDAAITVTVQAQDAGGNVDTSCSDDVTLVAGGSATGAGVVDITNGDGTLDISDTVAETVALSLSDSETTGLNVDSTQDVVFSPGTVPTIAGAGNTLCVDVDGQDSEVVTALTITSTANDDIGVDTSINITLSDANVTFDQSSTPAAAHGGAGDADVTKFTTTEIGIDVTTASSTDGDVITVSNIKVNLSAGTPDTAVVNFTVKTTPTVGSLKSQDYDALTIDYVEPTTVTIAHTAGVGGANANEATVGTNVMLTAHAENALLTGNNYGGWQVNFSITDAPSPLTWTANGLNSSFDNTTLDPYEEVTTDSDGDATLNLKLSTRSSEEDGATKTDVKAYLNGTANSATLGANAITTVDDYETHVNVTSDYESAVADGAELINFTAQLRDQYDNFVQDGGNASSGIGVGLTGAALPEDALPTAFVAGNHSFEVQDATQESVTATVDSTVVGIATGSKTVNYVSDAYGIALTANRTSCPADDSSVIRVYAQLLDASGNPLALHKDTPNPPEGVEALVSWTYSQSSIIFGQGVVFAGVNTSGVNYVDLVASTSSGVSDVTVYYNNISGSTMSSKITLTTTQSVNAGNTVVSYTPDPLSIKADEKVTFTVIAKDDSSQPVENAGVTFKIEGGNGTLTNAYNSLENATGLNQTLTVLSNSTGGVAVEFFNRDVTETDSVNITVVDGGVTTKIGGPYDVEVAHANASTIVLTPASQGIKNVNGTTATIIVTLKDAYDNPVDDNLVLNVTNGNLALGDLDTDAADGQITLVSGTKEVVFTIDSEPLEDTASILFEAFTTYNSAYLTANLTGFTATVTTSGPTGVVVSFNKTAPVVGETVAAYAQLTDASGNALGIADKDLTFTVKKGSATVAIGEKTTNASGIAVYDMTVSELGTYIVTASNSTLGLSNDSSITFAGSMVSIVATANVTTTPVNTVVTINATAMDSAGNVATGASGLVWFTVDGASIGSDTDGVASGSVAFVNGVASLSTYTEATAGTYTVLAWYNETISDTVDVTFTEDTTPTIDTITVAPAGPLTMNTIETQTFTATCKNGSTEVTGITVTWASSNETVGTIDSSGVFTADVNGTTTITAAAQGVTSSAVTVTVGAAAGLVGDINGDNTVDYIDLGMLGASYGLSIGDAGYNAAADLNGDNTVNYVDLGMLGAHYGESI